jgi:hypothetical protein
VEEVRRRIERLIEVNTRILKELEEINNALTRGDKRR